MMKFPQMRSALGAGDALRSVKLASLTSVQYTRTWLTAHSTCQEGRKNPPHQKLSLLLALQAPAGPALPDTCEDRASSMATALLLLHVGWTRSAVVFHPFPESLKIRAEKTTT